MKIIGIVAQTEYVVTLSVKELEFLIKEKQESWVAEVNQIGRMFDLTPLEETSSATLESWARGELLCYGLTLTEANAIIATIKANTRYKGFIPQWDAPLKTDIIRRFRRILIREALGWLPSDHHTQPAFYAAWLEREAR